MKVVPRYNLLPGTEITLLNRPMVVTGQSAEGYRVIGLEDGTASVIAFAKLVEYLKLPGAKLDTALPETGGRLKQRLGGYSTAEALSDEQRELARFHHAICRGLLEYRSKVREETGNPDFQLSNRIADRHECRKYVAAVAGAILGHRVRLNPRQGGKSKDLFLYKGRTLMDYFRIAAACSRGSGLAAVWVARNGIAAVRGGYAGECLKLCVSDLAHAVFRNGQAPKRPANIMAS